MIDRDIADVERRGDVEKGGKEMGKEKRYEFMGFILG